MKQRPVRIVQLDSGTEYLLPFAQKKLAQLWDGIDAHGASAPTRRMTSGSSGELVHVWISGGIGRIAITGGGFGVPLIVYPDGMTPSELLGNNLTITPSIATALGYTMPAGGWPAPFAIVLKNGRMKAVPAIDAIDARLGAVKRAIKRKDPDIAEDLLRWLEQEQPGYTGGFLDGALSVDGSLVVDLAYFAGKSYLDRLTAALSDNAGTFSHASPSDFLEEDAFPEVDFTKYVDPPNFTIPASPFRIFYMSGGVEVEVTANMSSPTAGMVLTNSVDTLPVGTVLTVRLAQLNTFKDTWVTNNLRRQDFIEGYRLLQSERQITVTASNYPSPGFTASMVTFASDSNGTHGPVTGTALPRGRRFVRHRTLTGWVVDRDEIIDVAPGEEIMPSTYDGNDPPGVITALPGGTQYLSIVHEDASGTQTVYAKAAYTSAGFAIAFNIPTNPSTFYDQATGFAKNARDSFAGNSHPHYNVTVAPVIAYEPTVNLDGLYLQKFKRPDGSFIALAINGTIRVVASDGTVTHTLPASNPSAFAGGDVAPMAEWHQFSAPAGTYPGVLGASRISLSERRIGIANAESPSISPPGDINRSVVYDATSGRYLYCKPVSGNWSDTALTVARLDLYYALALNVDGATLKAKLDALKALYTIELDGGLAPECVAFASAAISAMIL